MGGIAAFALVVSHFERVHKNRERAAFLMCALPHG